MEYRYEYLHPPDFLRAVKDLPVFYAPLGLLEWHGDHLPLGLDALKAHGICLRLAQRMGGGIVLPPTYFGRPGYSSYTGTLVYSEGLITEMIYSLLGQLQKVGAKVVVLLTGHYGPAQVDTVKHAANVFMKECPGTAVLARAEYEGLLVDSRVPGDHAGIFETSMMLALQPDLVRMDALEAPLTPPCQYPNPQHYYYHETNDWCWPKDLPEASAELGERALTAMVEHLRDLVLAALESQIPKPE